jgi:hypothetical protein
MNLAFIEYQPQKVLAAFRQGEFDGLEVIGQADERDFFQRCFQEHLLACLADSMPTARKKEEVPRWFILAANLSLKLHQENSFLAFERVVRCGGLLSALPPDLAAKHPERVLLDRGLPQLDGGYRADRGGLSPGLLCRRTSPRLGPDEHLSGTGAPAFAGLLPPAARH